MSIISFPRSVMLIDVDGTFFDFEKVDRKVISSVFKKKRLVRFVDKLAWAFNRLDILENTFDVFKLRMKFYSMVSGIAYDNIMINYELYYKLSLESFINLSSEKDLLKLTKFYEVKFITANPWAFDVFNKYPYECFYSQTKDDREYIIEETKSIKHVSFMVCNSVSDVRLANDLAIQSVYIGESILERFFNSSFSFDTFDEMVAFMDRVYF